jgi:uncharacterized protein (TIGR02145 family)
MSFFKNLFSKSKTEEKNIEPSFPIERVTFTDSRDGKTYKTVKIGNQVWMAENLCYKPNSGNYWAYENNQSNVARYGYLYDWETAEKVCPSGWHLPSIEEFKTLLTNFGGGGSNAFHALKEGGSSGFSALFGGWHNSSGNFFFIGDLGGWWSSSEGDTGSAWGLNMFSGYQDADMNDADKAVGFSVRCLQD